MTKIKIAILASGSGSNAQNIYHYFQDSNIEISLFLTNNPNAYVIERARKLNVACQLFTREEFKSNTVIEILQKQEIDLVVLAGFLWLVPSQMVAAFPNKIINIHPALLPKYGGKGMYGDFVHEAVKENKETETGISIHFVNEHYDKGGIIAQYTCKVEANDSPSDIAKKVHLLEYDFFPKEIEKIALLIGSQKI